MFVNMLDLPRKEVYPLTHNQADEKTKESSAILGPHP